MNTLSYAQHTLDKLINKCTGQLTNKKLNIKAKDYTNSWNSKVIQDLVGYKHLDSLSELITHPGTNLEPVKQQM